MRRMPPSVTAAVTAKMATPTTVESSPNYGVVFRPDPYGFDAQAMPQMFGPSQVAAAEGELERRS